MKKNVIKRGLWGKIYKGEDRHIGGLFIERSFKHSARLFNGNRCIRNRAFKCRRSRNANFDLNIKLEFTINCTMAL